MVVSRLAKLWPNMAQYQENINMPRFSAVFFALPKQVIWRAMSGSYVLIFEFKKSKG